MSEACTQRSPTPSCPVRITNQAVKMSETNPYVRGCAPLLGEHNDEVYQSLGFTPEEISAWWEKGVI